MAIDPLSEVIAFLRPRAVFSKVIGGAGRWAVRYSDFGQPSFCAVLEGGGLLAVVGQEPIRLMAGDFVLLPATPGFTLSSLEPGTPIDIDAQAAADDRSEGEIRHGRQSGHAEVRMLGGYFAFASPDSALLVALLPAVVHVRRVERLATLVALVRQESLQQRSGRELILTRLVEILLIEALRAAPEDSLAAPGLLRGLADSRLVAAFRSMHADPARAWTVEQLAHQSALSRSVLLVLPPMEYLLAWRMALAKNLLRRKELAIAEVAEQVGYASSSTFSTAFSRHVGQPPGQYARTN